MAAAGFTFPTLAPPPQAQGGRRRWAALSAAAALVGAMVGAVYFSLAVDPAAESTEWAPGTERRPAHAGSQLTRDWPLRWLSNAHVAVDVAARVSTRAAGPGTVRVALDTGSSHPVVTDRGLERLRLGRWAEPDRSVSSFSGAAVSAFGLSEPVLLDAAVAGGGVATPVWHYVRGTLFDADAVASPLALAPRGGAIRLDLVNQRFTRCESLERCLRGGGWSRLNTVPCPDSGGLFGVRVRLAGIDRSLMLDTGSPTLVTSALLSEGQFADRSHHVEATSLVGAGSSAAALRVTGDWLLEFGTPAVRSRLSRAWVLKPERRGPLARCFPDGTAGLDVFSACALVLEDDPVPRAYVRCAPDAAATPRQG